MPKLRFPVHLAVIALVPALLAGCASLPADTDRTVSYAIEDTGATRLGRSAGACTAGRPGKDGLYAVPSGREAFALRIALIAVAERTLDLQYYIWKPDMVGQLMFEQVWLAAERGVRVRLLLDDQQTGKLDSIIAVLNAHPGIEVRLFNPYAHRSLRIADMAFDFKRINRRMHNKSFVADNQVTILGGRNIGNEYFSADPMLDYSDLDVAAIGPVVRQVSAQFDVFWNSDYAYPAHLLLDTPAPDAAARLRNRWASLREEPAAHRYLEEIKNARQELRALETCSALEWAHARILYDDPEKIARAPEENDTHLLPRMMKAMGRPHHRLDIVSPYFVPGELWQQELIRMRNNGVQVRILTNSLAATDVAPVHAGYSKYRRELVAHGVELFELKPSAASAERRRSHHDGYLGSTGGSSGAALHAKTFAVDDSRIFIGSFNLDPRSARLNTEMGAVIESPAIARRLSQAFDMRIPENAYRIRPAQSGAGIEWVERTDAGVRVFQDEPEAGWLRRLWVDFLSLLPIESLL